MKRVVLYFLLLSAGCFTSRAATALSDSIEVYLLTCDAGTEVYSIYGHSAVRISIPETGFDRVYNWGLFDFSTPGFAFKFAKGRLDYCVGESSFQRFLDEYIIEERAVYSQKINLTKTEKESLVAIINNNMLPENRFYRYDFFYDNCATRIRDIIEKAIGDNLYYPDDDFDDAPSFRNKLEEAQEPLPWLNAGINLLIGMPGDRQMSYREEMFLPADLKENLSLASVKHGDEVLPLLQKPVILLDFIQKTGKNRFLYKPEFIFWMLFLVVCILTLLPAKRLLLKKIDVVLFSVFSVLALLMIFFTFFTDHQAMKMNLNILWLNPFLITGLASLIFKKCGTVWFTIIFIITSLFLLSVAFLPQSISSAFLPLILLIAVRSFDNSAFYLTMTNRRRSDV